MTDQPPPGLYKHTIIIWSEENLHNLSLEDLGHDADTGDSFCSYRSQKFILDEYQRPV